MIARWFFMASLTGRYTGGSPETIMEKDLASLRDFDSSEDFLKWIEKTIVGEFTDDFWSITLPNRLKTSSATSPILFAYYASLNLLDARVLFSKKKVSDLLDPALKAKKSATERHHLFPKNHLKAMGIDQTRDTNQIANYALVEWDDNIEISDTPPAEYCPIYNKRFNENELSKMYYWHALPLDWENLNYFEFLEARRELIAQVIRDGYWHLAEGKFNDPDVNTIDEIIVQGETMKVEFKSTLRMNLHTGEKDSRMEHECLKTIAGFLNSQGGTLIIGVNDLGEPLGIELDDFPNEDKMHLHLINLIKDRLAPHHMFYIQSSFETYKGKRIMFIDCSPSKYPVYIKNGNKEQFYIRTGAATTELLASQIQPYLHQRFN